MWELCERPSGSLSRPGRSRGRQSLGLGWDPWCGWASPFQGTLSPGTPAWSTWQPHRLFRPLHHHSPHCGTSKVPRDLSREATLLRQLCLPSVKPQCTGYQNLRILSPSHISLNFPEKWGLLITSQCQMKGAERLNYLPTVSQEQEVGLGLWQPNFLASFQCSHKLGRKEWGRRGNQNGGGGKGGRETQGQILRSQREGVGARQPHPELQARVNLPVS